MQHSLVNRRSCNAYGASLDGSKHPYYRLPCYLASRPGVGQSTQGPFAIDERKRPNSSFASSPVSDRPPRMLGFTLRVCLANKPHGAQCKRPTLLDLLGSHQGHATRDVRFGNFRKFLPRPTAPFRYSDLSSDRRTISVLKPAQLSD